MLTVAAVGLGVNLLSAWIFSRGGAHSLNLRAAAAHADAAGSVAALLAGALILARGWTIADPITSMAISVLIMFGAWRPWRDTTHVLMEGVPAGIDVAALDRLALRHLDRRRLEALVGDRDVDLLGALLRAPFGPVLGLRVRGGRIGLLVDLFGLLGLALVHLHTAHIVGGACYAGDACERE